MFAISNVLLSIKKMSWKSNEWNKTTKMSSETSAEPMNVKGLSQGVVSEIFERSLFK